MKARVSMLAIVTVVLVYVIIVYMEGMYALMGHNHKGHVLGSTANRRRSDYGHQITERSGGAKN